MVVEVEVGEVVVEQEESMMAKDQEEERLNKEIYYDARTVARSETHVDDYAEQD